MTSTPASEPFPRAPLSLPSRASITYLVVGAVAVGGYFLMPASAQDVWYIVIGASSVTAVAGSALRLAHARRAWLFFAAGLLVNVGILASWLAAGAGMLFAVRPALLALTLMVLGGEIIFASFFLSLLRGSGFGRV